MAKKRIRGAVRRFKQFFKRLIILCLLKINRRRQKRGASVYSTRHGFTLFSKIIYFFSHIPKGVQVSLETIDGVYGIRAIPPNKSSKIIFYIYGGSFVLSLDHIRRAYIPFAARLAKDAEAEVWIPAYRISPECGFPEPGEDCLANYLKLVERGVDPKDISVMGAGSGAALALALIMNLRDKNLPLPDSVATISAWTDLALTGNSIYVRSDRDPMLSTQSAVGYFNHYLQGTSPKEPLASPLYGDFTGFPRMYMIVGGREIFYDDTIRVAEKARRAGVDVTVNSDDNMVYGYPIFFDIFPQGRAAIKELAAFVNATSPLLLQDDTETDQISTKV